MISLSMDSSLTAAALFERAFLPLYPSGIDLAAARTVDANPTNDEGVLGRFAETAQIFSEMAVPLLGAKAPLDFSDESVHFVSRALTKELRDRLLLSGERGGPTELAQLVIHGTAYVGEIVVRHHGGAWRVRHPMWESRVFLKSAQGEGELAIFQWFVKALADESIEESLGTSLWDRYRAFVVNAKLAKSDLSQIAPADRRLPRLAKVSYHLLHKHLLAHLPEMRDLGKDFPSPERFDELGLKSLDLLLVGDGRMLVMAGLGTNGLHVFWLDKNGFQKGAFIPCDAFPAPMVKSEDERVVVDFARGGTSTRQEFLWWGP